MPPTSQLDWLSSTTAMIVLFWSRATRDLLKSFGWGIAALHRLHSARKLPSPRRPPHRISPSHPERECSEERHMGPRTAPGLPVDSSSRLLYTLKSRGPQATSALARVLGITVVGARQHLARLCAEGLVAFDDQ